MTRAILAAALAVAALAPQAHALGFDTLDGTPPIVIGHRGASGYQPEHTIEAYELAARQGVDFIEPDLQLTSDGELVAIHDTTLTRTTNIEALFAPRNGGYRVSDFTLAEIKTLTVDIKPAGSAPGYVSSYGAGYTVPTFAEVLDFANQWNADTGASIGVYPEAKAADIVLNQKLVQTLAAKGFNTTADGAYIQSFSVSALEEIEDFQVAEGTDIDLISLGYWLGGSLSGASWYGTDGATTLAEVATKVDGIGMSLGSSLPTDQAWIDFIDYAHSLGLSVVGWTFNQRDEAQALAQFDRFIDFGMDGFFANYPDYAVSAVAAASPVPAPAAALLLPLGLAAIAGLRRRRA